MNMEQIEVHRVETTHETFSDGEVTPPGKSEPIIHCFGYTKDRKWNHLKIRGFEPYCYVEYEYREAAKAHPDVKEVSLFQADGSHYESVRGKRLVKLTTYTTGDVSTISDDCGNDEYPWDQTWESDVIFAHRFMADMDLESGLEFPDTDSEYVHIDSVSTCTCHAEWRIHYVDIEVDDRNGFPEKGREPVISITAYDSFDDEYIIWFWEDSERVGEYKPELDGEWATDASVRYFDSEAEMILNYVAYLQGTKPSVFTAWNVEFDLVYLWDRMEFISDTFPLEPEAMSPMNEIRRSDYGDKIRGICVFDLLKGFKGTQYTDMSSYRLEDVAQEMLGVGKEDYVGRLGNLWEDAPSELLEYNLRDVELLVKLDEKQSIIEFWREVKRIARCPLKQAPVESSVVDKYLLNDLHGEFVLPRKGSQPSVDGSYTGGAVFSPVKGLFENVPMLDLKSLYPMSMLTCNISPETKVDPDEYDGETYVSPNGIHFRKDTEGITKSVIDGLLKEREAKKEERDKYDPDSNRYKVLDLQQTAVKVIMNSLYGVLAWNRFRLYDQDGAKATTACGREVLDFTAEVAEDMGHEVLYGDTDSVLLNFPDAWDKERCLEEAFDVTEEVNRRYQEYAEDELNATDHRFEIEFEKFYSRFFQSGQKKRYAGNIVWKEGKDVDHTDITGYDYQRSDASEVANQTQKKVLEMITNGEDTKKVANYISDQIRKFKQREWTLDEIGIPEGIGKKMDNFSSPTHAVRSAKIGNLLLGTTFSKGSKPKRYYLDEIDPNLWHRLEDERGLDATRDQLYRRLRGTFSYIAVERPEQLPPEVQINWSEHQRKNLKLTLNKITAALDLDWSELEDPSKQTGLDSFGD